MREDVFESPKHKELTIRIKTGLKSVGICLRDDSSPPLVFWVVKGQLTVAHRPLRNDPRWAYGRHKLPLYAAELVRDWVRRIREDEGIKSILCLLPNRELETCMATSDCTMIGCLNTTEAKV